MSRIDAVLGEAVAGLTDCNPFLSERVELEKRILGSEFKPFGAVWAADGDAGVFDPNLPRLRERVEEIVGAVHARLADGATATDELIAHYRVAVFYLLWVRTEDALAALFKAPAEQRAAALAGIKAAYARFAADAAGLQAPLDGPRFDTAHIFAVGFQARRAFHHIFRKIFGATLPAAQLRAHGVGVGVHGAAGALSRRAARPHGGYPDLDHARLRAPDGAPSAVARLCRDMR